LFSVIEVALSLKEERMLINRICFVAYLILLSFLSSCATKPLDSEIQEVDLSDDSAGFSSVVSKSNVAQDSALEQMLYQVEQAIVSQKFEQAAALAERAVRLEPGDGRPYFLLAKINFYQQQFHQARGFITKAQSLSTQDAALQEAINRFVSRNREMSESI
jgi:hypothetical protein